MYARGKQLEALEAGTVKLSCGCHVWVKSSLPSGYGRVSIGKDCKRKGRQNRPTFAGSRNGRAKFNETTALEAYRDQRSIKDIAATYGVTEAAVRQLKGGLTWQHVTSNAAVDGQHT